MTRSTAAVLLAAARDAPLAALAVLTRVPVAARGGSMPATARVRSGAAAFGVVGAGLGVLAAVPVIVAGAAQPLLAAALALMLIAVVSGALHLDGLADTADALAAPDRATAERARLDPRIGAAGAVALVGVLLIDAAALAGLIERAGASVTALVVVEAASASRGAAVVVAWATRHLRAPADDSGGSGRRFGAWFAEGIRPMDVVAAIGTAALAGLAVAVVGGAVAAASAGLGLVVGGLVAVGVVRLRGQLDGDGLGASVELTFAAVLVSTALAVGAAGPTIS